MSDLKCAHVDSKVLLIDMTIMTASVYNYEKCLQSVSIIIHDLQEFTKLWCQLPLSCLEKLPITLHGTCINAYCS